MTLDLKISWVHCTKICHLWPSRRLKSSWNLLSKVLHLSTLVRKTQD